MSMLSRFVIEKNIHKHAREDIKKEKCLQAILIVLRIAREHCGQCLYENHLNVHADCCLNKHACERHTSTAMDE